MSVGTRECPVCKGPIAHWVIREQFTCHHCNWAISTNARSALPIALASAVLSDLALLAGLWYYLGPTEAMSLYVAFLGALGCAVGATVYAALLRLVPLRPQRHREP